MKGLKTLTVNLILLIFALNLNAQELKPNDSIILFKLTLLKKDGKTPMAGQYLNIYYKETDNHYELISNKSGVCKSVWL